VLTDLIVHLDGGAEDETRLSHAEMISASFGARVTGLYTNPLPEYAMASGFDPRFSTVAGVFQLHERIHEEGDGVFARLMERLTRNNANDELRRLEAGAGTLPQLCASEARRADLFVATSYPNDARPDWGRLVKTVIFEGGRAVYLVPPGRKAGHGVKNILVAWRDTRESTRAIAEAVPFLKVANVARIVTVDPRDVEERESQAVDIAAHLDRHGANVEISAIDANGGTVGAVLLDEARRMSADLIVMGAYGHSRFREWILGGVTREMIAQSDTQILLAH
jgi:nucleotide-binding universal stress UspA family protein